MQTKETLHTLVSMCKFKDWQIHLGFDGAKEEYPYIQIIFEDKCIISGEREKQFCRKWKLSYWMCDTEVVQTVFAAIERAVLHEMKEAFTFDGRPIYSPHRSVYALYQIANGQVDTRDRPDQSSLNLDRPPVSLID